MSFFQSDPASCGPSNAINNLNKHVNTDRSMNHQFQYASGNGQQQGNRNELHSQTAFRTDARLENEFQQFANSSTMSNSFAPQFQYQQQQHQRYEIQSQSGQRGWINDFQQMSISNAAQQQEPVIQQFQGTVQNGGWSNEYSNGLQKNHINKIPENRYQSSYGSQLGNNRQMFTQSLRTQQEPEVASNSFSGFEKAFDEVEIELQEHQSQLYKAEEVQEELEEPMEEKSSEEDKIKFAEIAKNVFNTMSNTPSNISQDTGNKFQNSNFLKLMNKISTREVEINDQGNKFIDSQGKDIRDMLPDPLKDLREGDFSQSYYSNLDDKDFVGPFKAAQIVHGKFDSSQSMKPSQWDTMLDD